MQEDEIIAGCRKNDRRMQQALYERFLPYVLTVIRRYGVPERGVEDLIQEIFTEVFQKIDRYDAGRGRFSTWLTTLSVRRCIDRYRRRRPPVVRLEAERIATESPDISHITNDRLLEAIAGLPAGYRMVFNLYAVDGYSHAEIADLLGISPGTSRSQYARARKALRNSLPNYSKSDHHVK